MYIYFVIRFVLIMECTINLKVLKPFAKAFQTVLNFALNVCDILKNSPAKINYGTYSDTLEHLHFHLVPKYVDGPDFGGVFRMNPKEVYLSDEEYASMIERIKKEL